MLLEIKNLKAGFIRDKDYLEVIKGISLTIDQDEVVRVKGVVGNKVLVERLKSK